jgi:SAM-dependent methyltransferase
LKPVAQAGRIKQVQSSGLFLKFMGPKAFAKNLRTRFKNRVSWLIKRRIMDVRDDITELQQWVSLQQIREKHPPIPPKALQIRVAGAYYPEFFKHGANMFNDLDAMLKTQGTSLLKFERLLDFGCGCGRLLIPGSLLMPPGKLSGTDIDEQAIQWLKENYTCFHDLGVNGFEPPTKYPDGQFDFVFGISIFTHLPEEMELAWLNELSRIIQPGGYGIFTIHCENFFHLLTRQTSRDELQHKGFAYETDRITAGLPEFYQNSFHTHEYVRREWSRFFEVVAIHTKGVGNNQDAVMVRKRA